MLKLLNSLPLECLGKYENNKFKFKFDSHIFILYETKYYLSHRPFYFYVLSKDGQIPTITDNLSTIKQNILGRYYCDFIPT